MRLQSILSTAFFAGIFGIIGCSKNDSFVTIPSNTNTGTTTIPTSTIVDPYAAIKIAFGNAIDPNSLENYANQGQPAYILKNNLVYSNYSRT